MNIPINGNLKIADTEINYIASGQGSEPLVMIPGLGDGLKNAKGMAVPFSLMYRKIGRHFRVYAFSRRNKLPECVGKLALCVTAPETNDILRKVVLRWKELAEQDRLIWFYGNQA